MPIVCHLFVYFLIIVLETRQVSVSGGRREQATIGGIHYTTPLTCTIWATCNGYNKVCGMHYGVYLLTEPVHVFNMYLSHCLLTIDFFSM